MRNPIGPDAPKDSAPRTPIDPDADIHSYPPAVEKEADAAAEAAFETAMHDDAIVSRSNRVKYAAQKAGEAYAAVLARHVVAARLDKLNSGVVLTRGDSTDAEMRERGKAAAAEPSRAPFSTSSEPGQFGAALARLVTADTTPVILTFDDKTAGRFTVQPSASGSFTIGPPMRTSFHVMPGVPVYLQVEGGEPVEARTEIARLTAEREALAKELVAARIQAAEAERLDAEVHALKVYLGEARTNGSKFFAERNALAKRVEALRDKLHDIAADSSDRGAKEHAASALYVDGKAAQS